MNRIDELRPLSGAMRELRRDIHAHPELAFEENRTAAIVARELAACGIEVHTGLAKTGVVGTLRAGSSSRAIGLRADMDALPMQEHNDFAHRSRHAGKMHACGHDGHTAMLLGAAKHLAATKRFDGVVHFIFQPAEEGGGGGREMVKEGLFERFPVKAVYGMHNWPGMAVGEFAMRPGPMMASSDTVEILIRGRGAHGALPHHGADPITAGAAIVQSLQTIVSRNLDPIDTAVISITQFHGGDAWNVIPEEVVLRGTVRAFREATQAMIEKRIREIAQNIALAHGTQAEVHYRRQYPALANTPEETRFCAEVARELAGAERVHAEFPPIMASEDFAFMLLARPGCYVFTGNGTAEQHAGGCMLHNPGYDFNDEALAVGAAYWVQLVEKALATA